MMEHSVYTWRDDLSEQEWDELVAHLKGHPLQSAKWGNARNNSCGIKYYCWAAFKEGVPVFLARFEERIFLKFFKIAWIPKGPILLEQMDPVLYKEFFKRLKCKGFTLCVTNPWSKIEPFPEACYTIWIDLTVGKEQLWMNLQKQCRNDVKRAKKFGVLVEQSTSIDDLQAFYKICDSISKSKGFSLGDAARSMPYLFSHQGGHVGTSLFVARHENQVCGGAMLMTCGESVHYLWGAVDRQFSHLCVGEALQWSIMEWGVDKQFKKYDLEGISAKQDGGVDRFKKKLGGEVIAYSGMQFYPLSWGRRMVSLGINSYLSLKGMQKTSVNIFK